MSISSSHLKRVVRRVTGLAVALVASAAVATTLSAPAVAAPKKQDLVWSATPKLTKATDRTAQPRTTPWGACGVSTDDQKLVSNFHRDLATAANGGRIVPSGTTTFKCGNKGWGYRHLLYKNHDDDYADLAAGTGQNWRDVADLALTKTLNDPTKVTFNEDKNTFCFSTKIYLLNRSSGQQVGSSIVYTIIGNQNWNVITTYPPYPQAQCHSNEAER